MVIRASKRVDILMNHFILTGVQDSNSGSNSKSNYADVLVIKQFIVVGVFDFVKRIE